MVDNAFFKRLNRLVPSEIWMMMRAFHRPEMMSRAPLILQESSRKALFSELEVSFFMGSFSLCCLLLAAHFF